MDRMKETQYSIPTRANYPRQLIVYDGRDWRGTTDPRTIISTPYLAVSYRQTDFPNKASLEETVRIICRNRGLTAYWLDFACTGSSQTEKNEDLYRIADVFRESKETIIMISTEIDGDGWRSWGNRVWTYPEALLSKKLLFKRGDEEIKEVTLRQVGNLAYGDAEVENRLIHYYEMYGKDFSRFTDRVEDLCLAIWFRDSGPSVFNTDKASSNTTTLKQFTALPGERVYALMGLLQYRIVPNLDESAEQAFNRLLAENKLSCDKYPWIIVDEYKESLKSGQNAPKITLGLRDLTTLEKAEILPEYVPEAMYNHGERKTDICEEGTQESTLNALYDWLGLEVRREDVASTSNEHQIFWLKGSAGSGKSTIALTVAKRCEKEGILGATFFCSRDMKECSEKTNVFSTIAYQLCHGNDALRRKVSETFSGERDLQRAQPGTQLWKLIIEPLKRLALNNSDSFMKSVIIIDALDECVDDNTSAIIDALNENRKDLFPLKFLITSRRTSSNIIAAFQTQPISSTVQDADLDDVPLEEKKKDIRIYFERRLRPLAIKRGSQTWPPEDDLKLLVWRTNGLFIYASTTVKFLSDESILDPESQLRDLLGSSVPTTDSSPYRHLDLLYLQVLQKAYPQMRDQLQSRLQEILGVLILSSDPFSVARLGLLIDMPAYRIRETLFNLQSLIMLPEDNTKNIRLIHPSIHEFFVDSDRCTDERFVIRALAQHSMISQRCMQRLMEWSLRNSDTLVFLKSASFETRVSTWHTLKDDRNYVFFYSYLYWLVHLQHSDLSEETLKILDEFLSVEDRIALILEDFEFRSTGIYFMELFETLKTHPSMESTQELFRLLYQNTLFLLSKGHVRNSDDYSEKLSNMINYLSDKFLLDRGLFGMNKETAGLELRLVSMRYFSPKYEYPELNDLIHEINGMAEKLHKLMLRKRIPEDVEAQSKISLILNVLYRRLEEGGEGIYDVEHRYANYLTEVKGVKKVFYLEDDDDNAKTLREGLFSWKTSIEHMEIIFGSLFPERNGAQVGMLNLRTLNIHSMYSLLPNTDSDTDSTTETETLETLKIIISATFLNSDSPKVEELKTLMMMLGMPTDGVEVVLRHLLPFFSISESNKVIPDVLAILSGSITAELQGQSDSDSIDSQARFTIDLSHTNSIIAKSCMEKLLSFIFEPDIQALIKRTNGECLRWAYRRKWEESRKYAFIYWVFHIGEAVESLGEDEWTILERLLEDRITLGSVVRFDSFTVRVFLRVFWVLGKRTQSRASSAILQLLFDRAMYLCARMWPLGVGEASHHDIEQLKRARKILRFDYSYEDGLYGLDPNYPLLKIALYYFSSYKTPEEIVDQEKYAEDLRELAGKLDALLVKMRIPVSKESQSEIQEKVRAIYETLKSNKDVLSSHHDVSRYRGVREMQNAYSRALSSVRMSLREFMVEIEDILDLDRERSLSVQVSELPESMLGQLEHAGDDTISALDTEIDIDSVPGAYPHANESDVSEILNRDSEGEAQAIAFLIHIFLLCAMIVLFSVLSSESESYGPANANLKSLQESDGTTPKTRMSRKVTVEL